MDKARSARGENFLSASRTNTRGASCGRPAHAFTLVELLAVISIIAILAGILIPVVGKIRDSARASQCVTNLHQIGVAIGAYASDNRGTLPVNANKNPNYPADAYRWYLLLAPYMGKQTKDWTDVSTVFQCPSNLGNVEQAGYSQYALWTSYGYLCNLQLMPKGDADPNSWTPSDVPHPVRTVSVNKRRILAADTFDQIKTNSNVLWVYYGNTSLENSSKPMKTWPADVWHIHGKGINALWTDYSVSWIAESDVNRPGSEIPGGQYFGRGN